MEKKKFTMIDEDFICDNCHQKVEKLGYTARDHCPYCLYSKHVDINPGDRANNCHGPLKPIGADKFKDTYKIVYECQKCGEMHRNIMASDDSFDALLEIMRDNSPF